MPDFNPAIRKYEKMVRATAVYPQAQIQFSDPAITYTVVALAGEVGELANVWKKHLRDPATPIPMVRMMDELGDVLWYVTAMVFHLGITLDDLMQINAEKLHARAASGTLAHRPPGDS